MNPSFGAPSRRSVSALAAWSVPVVAVALAAPAAVASETLSAPAEQEGWNVAARSGTSLSSGGLSGYTGFAFQETAGRVPAPVIAFVETYILDITATWSEFESSSSARAEALGLAASVMLATLVAPTSTTAGVSVGAWSAVAGPSDQGPTYGIYNGVINGGVWNQVIRWRATRTVTVTQLGALGQAGYSEVASVERPYGSQTTAFSFSLTPVAGSGTVADDDTPVLRGTVTVAPNPGPPSNGGGGTFQPDRGGNGPTIPPSPPGGTPFPQPTTGNPTSGPSIPVR
ncbi:MULTISPECIES: hypothetical protein [unclassified Rathayibacter]|uniref:hypothetical protein n=1 Tax=unclassified Rathayibacter TaxID=2609250 RepID=UPI00188B5A9C|nr:MULTISPECIES: hypothetical protein [unclassified Rathayibacter]MBF4463531.1 hypothetical protein [Rathayibacter sp. VKM Ac-2879]MBF4505019.1 hypothetical protein [Rathayibacter sp. VKM Ac-2878]